MDSIDFIKDSFGRFAENKDLVAHFTWETPACQIAISECLKFSPLVKSNDPRERELWRPTQTGHEFDGITNAVVENALTWKERQERLRVLSCSIRGVAGADGYPVSKLRMWAHYAHSHTGVCFVLDRSRVEECLRSTCKRFWCERVAYSSDAVGDPAFSYSVASQQSPAGVDEHFDQHYKRLFFSKSEDWRDEQEYRFAIDSKDDFSVGLDVLAAIVLGKYSSTALREAFSRLATRLDVPCWHFTLSSRHPMLMPENELARQWHS